MLDYSGHNELVPLMQTSPKILEHMDELNSIWKAHPNGCLFSFPHRVSFGGKNNRRCISARVLFFVYLNPTEPTPIFATPTCKQAGCCNPNHQRQLRYTVSTQPFRKAS